MNYQFRGVRNNRGINKILWLGAALSFISVAILVGSIIRQVNVPPYEKDFRRAQSLKWNDYPQANKLFRSAMEGADAAGANAETRFKNIQEYGDFLSDQQNNFDEAIVVLKHGIDSARKAGDAKWEGTFAERLARLQYWALQAGAIETADPQPALDAIRLRPEEFKNPSLFAANCYWDLGQIYIESGQFDKGDEALVKAKALFDAAGEELPDGFHRAEIASLIAKKKFVEANKLFIREMGQKDEDDESAKRLRIDFYWEIEEGVPDVGNVRTKARSLFKKGDFTALEKFGNELEQGETPTPTNVWRMDDFYNGIDYPAKYSSEAVWRRAMDLDESWKHQFPKSVRARLAHAQLLSSYAWKLRKEESDIAESAAGDDDKIGKDTDDMYERKGDRKRFKKRIATAWDALQDIEPRGRVWYTIALEVMAAPGHETRFDNLYAEFREKYPTYYGAILSKAAAMQRREGGEATARFLADECDKLPESDRNEAYGLVVNWLDRDAVPDVIHAAKVDWPRAKRGLRSVIAKNPKLMSARAGLSCLALEAQEPDIANTAFKGLQ